MSASLLEPLAAGDVRALARAISLLERDSPAAAPLLAAAHRRGREAAVTGLTGPPGAGKSTLAAALTRALRAERKRVALLSVDPSSTFTGGALLGDRVRLAEHFLDDGVFIRSMASRGALGGLAGAVLPAVVLAACAGFDEVLVETVGVGQSETDLVHHADTVVLVLMPGAGDVVQAIKAGVMEIADVIVINKADRPGADDLARDLRRAAALRPTGGWRVPIVQTCAESGAGVAEALTALRRHRAHLEEHGELAARRRRSAAAELVRRAVRAYEQRVVAQLHDTDAGREVLDAVLARRLDPAAGAAALAAEVPA